MTATPLLSYSIPSSISSGSKDHVMDFSLYLIRFPVNDFFTIYAKLPLHSTDSVRNLTLNTPINSNAIGDRSEKTQDNIPAKTKYVIHVKSIFYIHR